MNLEKARQLMGDNLFGPDEWERLFGVRFSPHEREQVRIFPYEESVLLSPSGVGSYKVHERHLAFLGLSSLNGRDLTLLHWADLLGRREDLNLMVYLHDRDREESFAHETCRFGWYLMPWDPVWLWDESSLQATLPHGYSVVTAIEQVTLTLLAHVLPRRQILNRQATVLCNSTGRAGFPVGVGPWEAYGPLVEEVSEPKTNLVGVGSKRELHQ